MIPHDLDINTPEELYIAMYCLPIASCVYEAIRLHSHGYLTDPVDAFDWSIFWRDTVLKNHGYMGLKLIHSISNPEAWRGPEAGQAYPDSLYSIRKIAVDTHLYHEDSSEEALACLATRCHENMLEVSKNTKYETSVTNEIKRFMEPMGEHKCGL